jgi:type I restriction enzyme M protein
MLIESANYVAALPEGKVGNNINISLYGQEHNLSTWAIGKLNMILHNYMDAALRKGDTLVNPQHKGETNELMMFDRIIANPRFSMDGWWTPAENSQEVKLDKDGSWVKPVGSS